VPGQGSFSKSAAALKTQDGCPSQRELMTLYTAAPDEHVTDAIFNKDKTILLDYYVESTTLLHLILG